MIRVVQLRVAVSLAASLVVSGCGTHIPAREIAPEQPPPKPILTSEQAQKFQGATLIVIGSSRQYHASLAEKKYEYSRGGVSSRDVGHRLFECLQFSILAPLCWAGVGAVGAVVDTATRNRESESEFGRRMSYERALHLALAKQDIRDRLIHALAGPMRKRGANFSNILSKSNNEELKRADARIELNVVSVYTDVIDGRVRLWLHYSVKAFGQEAQEPLASMDRAISIFDIPVGSTPDESLALGLRQAVANVVSEIDASLIRWMALDDSKN